MAAVDLARFAERLRRARREAGMTQEALAEATGYSQGAVSAWEAGDVVPTLPALLAIAKALPLSMGDLVAALEGVADAPSS